MLLLYAGLIHAGIGETQLNKLLNTMNIPSITHTTIDRCRRHLCKPLETVAEKSCDEALSLEM